MGEVTQFALERSTRRKRGTDRDVQKGTSKEYRRLQHSNTPRDSSATSSVSGQASGAVCVGIDEVGRGCWAGPLLVVAARKNSPLPKGLKDSKLLSRLRREALYEQLVLSCQFGEGWVTPTEIDKYGLAEALRVGVARSLKALEVTFDEQIVMDGKVNYIPNEYTKVKCIINADVTVPLVSAASVYAKVLRDRHMIKLAQKHPKYGFERHVGYGTAYHSAALKQHGAIDGIHRKSYRPIIKILGANS